MSQSFVVTNTTPPTNDTFDDPNRVPSCRVLRSSRVMCSDHQTDSLDSNSSESVDSVLFDQSYSSSVHNSLPLVPNEQQQHCPRPGDSDHECGDNCNPFTSFIGHLSDEADSMLGSELPSSPVTVGGQTETMTVVEDERMTPTQSALSGKHGLEDEEDHNNNHGFVVVPTPNLEFRDSSFSSSLDYLLRRSSTCTTATAATSSSNTSENNSTTRSPYLSRHRSDLFDADGRINWDKEGDWIQAYVNLLHLTPTKKRTCGCGLRRRTSNGDGSTGLFDLASFSAFPKSITNGFHSVINSPLHASKTF